MAGEEHSEGDDILFAQRGPLALIKLNRPEQLNALTHDMIRRLDAQLRAWAEEPSVRAVAIEGAGDKAFCAGGDVRALYEQGREDGAGNFAFYADEYRLNQLIKRFPKPYVAFMDGIVMGGGVGVSLHGTYRVGGDRTSLAMPEAGIGLFPDVGASYFLPRLPNGVGYHLALTGARLDAPDCLGAHLIDYITPSDRTALVIEGLAEAEYDDEADEIVCEILALNSIAPQPPALRQHGEEIAAAYAGETVEEILSALDAGSDWAREQAAKIRKKSPTSLRYTLAALRRGMELSFEDCLRMEYRLARACMTGADFYEGVRAIVIDKDNAPRWSPKTLAEVSDTAVEAALAPLGEEELAFN